jgi:hypothetical protein
VSSNCIGLVMHVTHMDSPRLAENSNSRPKKSHPRGRTPAQEDERRLRKVIEAAFQNPCG